MLKGKLLQNLILLQVALVNDFHGSSKLETSESFLASLCYFIYCRSHKLLLRQLVKCLLSYLLNFYHGYPISDPLISFTCMHLFIQPLLIAFLHTRHSVRLGLTMSRSLKVEQPVLSFKLNTKIVNTEHVP